MVHRWIREAEQDASAVIPGFARPARIELSCRFWRDALCAGSGHRCRAGAHPSGTHQEWAERARRLARFAISVLSANAADAAQMIHPEHVHLAIDPVDMRWGIERLSCHVQHVLGRTPVSGWPSHIDAVSQAFI